MLHLWLHLLLCTLHLDLRVGCWRGHYPLCCKTWRKGRWGRVMRRRGRTCLRRLIWVHRWMWMWMWSCSRLKLGCNVRIGAPCLVVPVHDSTLDCWCLPHVLSYMRRPKMRTSSLCTELRLYIDPFTTYQYTYTFKLEFVLPFSNRILSNREFLYLNMRHSSAALLCAVWRLWRLVSWTRMDSSSCLMYSVRRSLNAA
jgi:hypothetical protein